MTEAVWTAVHNLNPPATYEWQPCLDGVGAFEIWFRTEDECIEFIKNVILGAELAEECRTIGANGGGR